MLAIALKSDRAPNPQMSVNIFTLMEQLPVPSSDELPGDSFHIPALSQSHHTSKPAAVVADSKSNIDSDDWRSAFVEDSTDDTSDAAQRMRVTDMHSPAMHRALTGSLWLVLLPSMPRAKSTFYLKRILLLLPSHVFPLLSRSQSVTLADWLADCANEAKAGVMSLLAMDGIYILIRDYGLDYPSFYKRLYRLLTPDVLHVRYRGRFFRLLSQFLSSE